LFHFRYHEKWVTWEAINAEVLSVKFQMYVIWGKSIYFGNFGKLKKEHSRSYVSHFLAKQKEQGLALKIMFDLILVFF
jgi:hypothetical protein